jgi:hypothetical protein
MRLIANNALGKLNFPFSEESHSHRPSPIRYFFSAIVRHINKENKL